MINPPKSVPGYSREADHLMTCDGTECSHWAHEIAEDPDDYIEEPEYDECPTHGHQLVKGYGSTGGPDPYSKTLLACGDAVICLGPGDPMVLCGKWAQGELVPSRFQ